MQAIVKLALQVPGELRMIQIAGMDREYVGMHRNRRVLQVDQNFDDAIAIPCRESQQGMVVESQVIEDLGKIRGGHASILLRSDDGGRSEVRWQHPRDWDQGFTTCFTVPALGLRNGSPEYLALMVSVPALEKEMVRVATPLDVFPVPRFLVPL